MGAEEGTHYRETGADDADAGFDCGPDGYVGGVVGGGRSGASIELGSCGAEKAIDNKRGGEEGKQ